LRKLAAFLRPFWEARMRDVPNCFQFSDKWSAVLNSNTHSSLVYRVFKADNWAKQPRCYLTLWI
jgi:hypothetical protein